MGTMGIKILEFKFKSSGFGGVGMKAVLVELEFGHFTLYGKEIVGVGETKCIMLAPSPAVIYKLELCGS